MGEIIPDELLPSILGVGFKVPNLVRKSDDPIFAYLNELKKTNPDPFYGYDTRHVLSETEGLLDIMKPAAEEALETAGIEPKDVDVLLGCTSVGRYIVPSDLYELHRQLKLDARALAVPLGNDFSNFNVALVFADALIRAGRAKTILIAIGGDWSRAVDYRTIQAFSAADGAAAVVVGIRPNAHEWQRWHVAGEEVLAVSTNFGTMYLSDVIRTDPRHSRRGYGEPATELWVGPYFHITPKGETEIRGFGAHQAWQPAVKLLQRKGVSGSKVTLMGHQAADALLDHWEKKINPAYLFKTIKHYANMTVANIPVNLALALSPKKADERERLGVKQVDTPYILLLALGPDMHSHALLLQNAEIAA